VKEVVKLFNTQENNWAQLVFTSHDVTLLDDDVLKADQIRFTEKDKYWASTLYALDEYSGLWKLKSIEKAYLQGRFGAIPAIQQFSFSS
jgi:AAA15 family ATPase/GTPase